MPEELEKLPYWTKLSGEEKHFVAQNTVIRSYPKNTYLKGNGQACLGMIFVLKGTVRTLLISEEGREITLFRLSGGDACVLSATCVLSQVTFETQMVTTEPTQILVVNSGAYAELMQKNLEVRCFSYELATLRFSSVIWVLQEIIFARFDRRLARYLLETSSRTGKNEITMSKEAIARDVNTAREVVSRMLKQFADDGLVSMDQKTVRILDPEGLRSLL